MSQIEALKKYNDLLDLLFQLIKKRNLDLRLNKLFKSFLQKKFDNFKVLSDWFNLQQKIQRQQMSKITKIDNEWIDELFENENFTARLKSFLKEQKSSTDSTEGLKSSFEIEQISEEISSLLSEHMLRQNDQKSQQFSEQITKMNNQIGILKNYLFGCQSKQDLQTTCNNRSKLQISSILQQDNNFDFGQVKSSLIEIQQRLDFWFGKTSTEKQSHFHLEHNSKIFTEVDKKCNEAVSNLETKIKKIFQNTDLLFQRRIQLISKTLNNVLQMINQNPNKSQVNKHIDKNLPKQNGNPHSLLKQSSLQNLKIKNFFTFGHR